MQSNIAIFQRQICLRPRLLRFLTGDIVILLGNGMH
ncbi:hypothetical protein WRSd3_03934 [Shigella dysenteriae WRSd3]|uniref:Uncharacterized protein n=2 Tax=Shigella dysenteriae TaxID=622 RepID=A0A090NCB5_SHIDY|nr:hypothetical protein Asd1617_04871 [Shigella dysenteriae 1617]ESU77166.1 hypothetical protein WRSd3_03934 [Shigella dysenteriae WRSd3]ESU84451.1 hypothetical protein WRSd5_00762 [Shigella dysenteriae WRSd5]